MKASVNWLKNEAVNFEGITESGNRVVMDSAQTLGPKPMEHIGTYPWGCS